MVASSWSKLWVDIFSSGGCIYCKGGNSVQRGGFSCGGWQKCEVLADDSVGVGPLCRLFARIFRLACGGCLLG